MPDQFSPDNSRATRPLLFDAPWRVEVPHDILCPGMRPGNGGEIVSEDCELLISRIGTGAWCAGSILHLRGIGTGLEPLVTVGGGAIDVFDFSATTIFQSHAL